MDSHQFTNRSSPKPHQQHPYAPTGVGERWRITTLLNINKHNSLVLLSSSHIREPHIQSEGREGVGNWPWLLRQGVLFADTENKLCIGQGGLLGVSSHKQQCKTSTTTWVRLEETTKSSPEHPPSHCASASCGSTPDPSSWSSLRPYPAPWST
jgi:hypothetical protein